MNHSRIYTTRVPSTVKTYQTVGYLLTDTERTVVIVILFSIAGIIVITGITIWSKVTNKGIKYLFVLEIASQYYQLPFSVVFCCFYKLYNVFLKTIECHICSERVRVHDWRKPASSRSGGHRKECAESNKEFLKALPEPFDVRCPTCFSYLKLLPKVIDTTSSILCSFMIIRDAWYAINM